MNIIKTAKNPGKCRKIQDKAESELREKVFLATQQAPLGVAIFDKKRVCEFCNERFAKLNKKKIKDIVGKHWTEFIQVDDKYKPLIEKAKKHILIEDRPIEEEIYDIKGIGEDVWEKVLLFPIKDKTGNIIGTCYSSKDITKEKNMEEKICRNEAKYRQLFEDSYDAVYIYDVQGNILDANKTALNRHGYTRKEMLGLTIKDLVTPETFSQSPLIKKALKTKGFVSFEGEFRKTDGSTGYSETFSRVIELDNQKVVQSISREVTAKKESELKMKEKQRALERSEKFLKSVLDSATDIIFSVDCDCIVNSWNVAAKLFSEYSASDIIGKSVLNIVNEKDVMKKAISNGKKTQDIALTIITKDNRKKRARFSVSSLMAEEGRAGLVFVGRAVSGKMLTIERGKSYLLKDRQDTHEMLANLLDSRKGILISRFKEKRTDYFERLECLDIIFMQNSNLDLDKMFKMVENCFEDDPNKIVMLERVDYIINSLSVENFFRFVYRLNDLIKNTSGNLFVSVQSAVLAEKELALLEEELVVFPEIPNLLDDIDENLLKILHLVMDNMKRHTRTLFKDVCKELRISSVTTRRWVNHLVSAGYIHVEEIGRVKAIHLTEKAKQMMK